MTKVLEWNYQKFENGISQSDYNQSLIDIIEESLNNNESQVSEILVPFQTFSLISSLDDYSDGYLKIKDTQLKVVLNEDESVVDIDRLIVGEAYIDVIGMDHDAWNLMRSYYRKEMVKYILNYGEVVYYIPSRIMCENLPYKTSVFRDKLANRTLTEEDKIVVKANLNSFIESIEKMMTKI